MKYNAYLKEDNYVLALNELQETSVNAKFPLKQILHSITAESYWNYYQQNQWKINQRTHSSDFKNDDISTWDLKTIANKTTKEYLLSLSSRDSLQQTNITDFKTIINYSKFSEELQPTLYDFLGGRAISFFNNTQYNLTKPADFFQVNNEDYFSSIKHFSKTNISSTDTLSSLFQAILVYQELERFHLKKKNYNSAVHYAIKRLDFVKNNSSNPLKNDLYLKGLVALINDFPKETENAITWSKIAEWHNKKGNEFNVETGANQFERKKALEICDRTMADFPNSYGADKCKALKISILQKQMSFDLENMHRPNAPIKMIFEHKNVSSVYFKIIKVDWDFTHNRYDIIDGLNKLEPIKSWDIQLEDNKDYQTHLSNLKIESLPFGRYFVIAGTSSDFKVSKKCNSLRQFLGYQYELFLPEYR